MGSVFRISGSLSLMGSLSLGPGLPIAFFIASSRVHWGSASASNLTSEHLTPQIGRASPFFRCRELLDFVLPQAPSKCRLESLSPEISPVLAAGRQRRSHCAIVLDVSRAGIFDVTPQVTPATK
jgi:hypothetical protein